MTLYRRRIYILPTGAGYAYLIALLIMLLWAINYSNSLAYALTFLLGSISLGAMWQTHNTLLDLCITPGSAEPVFAGQRALFRYRFSQPGPTTRYGIGLRWRSQSPVYRDVSAAGVEFELPVAALSRGVMRPGWLRVNTRFPLGLFQAWSWIQFDQSCLVYPQPRGKLPLPPIDANRPNAQGDASSGRTDVSSDFSGLRDYRPGDPARHIAWRASARSDYSQLQVKQFSGEADGELWLDWHRLAFNDREARLSQLCRWVLQADAKGYRYGLRLPGQTLAPASGASHRHRCLKALAQYGYDHDNGASNLAGIS